MSHETTVKPITVSPVHYWPLDEHGHRFVLGRLIDVSAAVVREYAQEGIAAGARMGRWECELSDDRLTWSDEVYDLFGVPRGAHVTRAEALTYYRDHSRAAMERLRCEAIEQNRAFVIDAEMRLGHGRERCWMRVVGAPVSENGKVTRLQGFKQIL